MRPKTVAQQADDAIDVAHRRNLRRADDDRFFRAGHRVTEAHLDAGRTIDQHVVEAFAQPRDERAHACGVDLVFFARLRRREQEQVVAVLVADQRLVELDLFFQHVEQMIFDPALESEHDIEIAQTDVGIDEHDARAALRQRSAEICRRRRLADAAFPEVITIARPSGRPQESAGATRAENRLSLLHEITPLSVR